MQTPFYLLSKSVSTNIYLFCMVKYFVSINLSNNKQWKHFCLLYLVGNHFDPILYYSLTPLRKIYLCLLLDGNILTKTIFVCFWTYKESRHFCGNDLGQIWLDVFCTLKVFFAFQLFLTILVATSQKRLSVKGL